MSEAGQELVHLVWGKKAGPRGLADTIFCRWAQGFVFSESESTALEQFEGGPCAVIAPVQAFLLKRLFTSEKSNWRDCPEEDQKNLLCHTLCDILEMACSDNSESYSLATWIRGKTTEETASISESPAESSHQEEQPSALAVEELGFERFHALIHKRAFKSFPEMKDAVWDQYSVWTNRFGVLLFLYSVILTKGIENIKNEIEDAAEPLIDPVYGHGSQSLINLLLTGHAVSNVWDGDRECSGMKLLGIHKQATVGFLTLMESLRYCKVGSYLKSPKFPIWILGSETHLTVFFAKLQHCGTSRLEESDKQTKLLAETSEQVTNYCFSRKMCLFCCVGTVLTGVKPMLIPAIFDTIVKTLGLSHHMTGTESQNGLGWKAL
ncbi:ubiquitin carboxyl-terminal hydrolase MINDY-3 isoform X4 [Lathamus discolor]|uniref:ubiquitin carboxyl-terminal hydrolase MINDY-3 isoform X4 n=1 Tax=Lathamus discolor TaxID=678569 RepID=UPI0032B8041A